MADKLRTSSSTARSEPRIFEECETDGWVERHVSLLELDVKNPRYSTIIFATASDFNNPEHLSLFPPRFQPTITDDLNGAFECEDIPDETGQFFTQHTSWSTYKIKRVLQPNQYHWTQATLLIHWNSHTKIQIIYIIDLPGAPREFLKTVPPGRLRAHDPYAWHAAFATAMIPEYDRSIWGLRHLVRDIEKGRVDPSTLTPDFFPHLHDIARHIFHANETLEVAQHTLDSLVREQIRSAGLYHGLHAGANSQQQHSHTHTHTHNNHNHNDSNTRTICNAPTNHPSTLQTERSLRCLAKQLHALHTRSRSLTERLHNEINLGFNLVSQRFGHDAKSDSAMMRTIAVVSMVYLPGTFVSGLFGTNFFNFTDGDEHTWFMAGSFWLYWAVTIPLTLATMAVWAWWHYLSPAKRNAKNPVRGRVETAWLDSKGIV
ncbi:uncharacterized protein BO97DRAFT_407127 [Aspergillus homomorphus CBS 101889]|uniref:Cora-domain-containing protein n=1 Tax=Aspergillus homomorphus (strain CBS 101889) TaxID=1450537 RepID=A0A395HS65_ASPHC|nr:hypothetical protein BO97DRAFT_407127 [Aspergillus homomorphus CBS 101889]RAL10263.1 hypothetical protein BO97DRAFT_407127 [Aspergillus homomorphus CBS 101889]